VNESDIKSELGNMNPPTEKKFIQVCYYTFSLIFSNIMYVCTSQQYIKNVGLYFILTEKYSPRVFGLYSYSIF